MHGRVRGHKPGGATWDWGKTGSRAPTWRVSEETWQGTWRARRNLRSTVRTWRGLPGRGEGGCAASTAGGCAGSARVGVSRVCAWVGYVST
jgi:hypothetical protein